MRTSLWVIVATLSFSFAGAASAGPRIEAGEWEFQMKMEMPGMPANMPAMS